jgi:hypothetical protein
MEALDLCPAPHQARLRVALTRLIYGIQSARASLPSEIDELPHWSRHAAYTCDMGLHYLSEDSAESAAMLLQTVSLERIFQAGHAAVVRISVLARTLRRSLGGAASLCLLEPEVADLVAGLLRAPPERPVAFGDPSQDPSKAPSSSVLYRPFASLAEVQQARDCLEESLTAARLLVGLAEQDLPITCKRLRDEMVSHVEADLRLTSLLATVIAWTLLDGRPRLEALPLDRFVAFLSTAFETQAGGRVIKPALRVGLSRALLATPEVEDLEVSRLQRFVERTLQRVESELGGLDPAQPLDKRFVGAALVVSAS